MTDAAVTAFDIQASRTLTAHPEMIFGFLADLENHWLIADRFVDVVGLTGSPGARTGGRVQVRGPLGIRRTATTRVVFARPMREMGGSAQISGGTVAHVRWLLTPKDGRTDVTLGATIVHADALDRLLLRAGGTAWMRSRFEGALQNLEHRLAPGPVAQGHPHRSRETAARPGARTDVDVDDPRPVARPSGAATEGALDLLARGEQLLGPESSARRNARVEEP